MKYLRKFNEELSSEEDIKSNMNRKHLMIVKIKIS
jgi:hypothetical protein